MEGEPNRLRKYTVAVTTGLLLSTVAAGILAGAVAGDRAAPARKRAPALDSAGRHEVVTWAAAPADLGPLPGFGVPAVPAVRGAAARPTVPPAGPGSPAGYRTARDVVHTSVDGWNPRIRLSNEFGTRPVVFDDVELAAVDPAQPLSTGPQRRVMFGGNRSVTVPPGAEALSDPVPGYLPPASTLAVSVHTASGGLQVTGHPAAAQYSYLSPPGDYATSGAVLAWNPIPSWLYLDGITVTAPRIAGTVVTFGDSITDGFESLPGANARWPDDLARRLLALPSGQRLAVANEGLASNRLTASGFGVDGGRAGLSAQARFDRDVLAQPGVRTVILEEGINDIGGGAVPAVAQLIAADTQLIARAHSAGVRILGGTLTPFAGAGYYSPVKEVIRQRLNAWIRGDGAFDGVVDFDQALRDPAAPSRLAPAYDSGDHIHPDDAGYQAMADAVSLTQLTPSGRNG